MANILKKKYSDLTLGEILGWSVGAGLAVLALEVVSLRGIDSVKSDVSDAAKLCREKGSELYEEFDQSIKKLKVDINLKKRLASLFSFFKS